MTTTNHNGAAMKAKLTFTIGIESDNARDLSDAEVVEALRSYLENELIDRSLMVEEIEGEEMVEAGTFRVVGVLTGTDFHPDCDGCGEELDVTWKSRPNLFFAKCDEMCAGKTSGMARTADAAASQWNDGVAYKKRKTLEDAS